MKIKISSKISDYFSKFRNLILKSITKSDKRPCKFPFEYCEITYDGKIYPCCPNYLKIKLNESIVNKDFDKIWNGEIFTELRNKILKGDFSMCNKDVCLCYKPFSPKDLPSDYKNGPKEIKIAYDYECNYSCITCRDKKKVNTQEEIDFYDNIYLPQILDMAKNAEYISLSGSGDPLYSRHTRHLIKMLVNTYPHLKFNICTNGYLLNEKTLNELGILNNLNIISVSLDAATAETYHKILGKDAFNTVINNLEEMAKLKKEGKIKRISLNFVIHIINYKEMADFVELAKRLDARAEFTTYLPWPWVEYHKQYNEVAVFEPENKYYNDFVEILNNSVFLDKEHCLLEPRLKKIVGIK